MILVVVKDIADLFASRQGRASSANADFGAIARDFGPKFCGSESFFEIFGPKDARNPARRMILVESGGRQRHCRPVCLVNYVGQRGFRRDRT